MFLEWVTLANCPVCGSHEIDALTHQRGVYRMPELKTKFYGCSFCGVEFQNPRIDNIGDFYSLGNYRQMLAQRPERVADEGRRRAIDVIEYLKKRLPTVNSFLDYGSATGELLDTVHKTYGALVQGVEIDPQLVAYANTRGRNTALQLCGRDYDLVAIVHVLEHLPKPTETLRNLKDITNGHIYVEVPKDAQVEAHLISFSPGSLRRCAELAGIEVIEMGEVDNNLILWGVV